MEIKKYLKRLINTSPKQNALILAKKLLPKYFKDQFDYLKELPRYTAAELEIFGKKIKIADFASFRFTSNEIFNKEIYKFKTALKKPYIIDCGANIGLSIIYFKKLYPEAEIIGFEPDQKIFDMLENNIKSFGFNNVQVIQKAVWDKESEEDFFSEGADGGRLSKDDKDKKIIRVDTVRLRKYLEKPVDFLKIDIEGAEYEVLNDCRDMLGNVRNLFVEYHSFSDQEQKLSEILKILKKAGFRYYIHHVGILSPHPFEEKRSYAEMDMQLNIYACRF